MKTNRIFFNSFNEVRLVWRFLLFVLISGIITGLLQIILDAVLQKGLLRGILFRLGYALSILFSLYIQICYLDKSSFEKYGLKVEKLWLSEFFYGCLIAFSQLSLFFFLMYSTNCLEITGYFITSSNEINFLAGFLDELVRQLTVSVSEEILFRSFLIFIVYEALYRSGRTTNRSVILACLIIAPLFSIAHLANEGATIQVALNLTVDSLMMTLPFLITGRLGMSIGMHFSWNLVQTSVFGFPNSGQLGKVALIDTNLHDNIFTGGLFGPEGSVLLLVLDAIAVILIIYWKRIKKYSHWINPLFAKMVRRQSVAGFERNLKP